MLKLEVALTKEAEEVVSRLETVLEKLEALAVLNVPAETKSVVRVSRSKAAQEVVADETDLDLDTETEVDADETTLEDVIHAMKALPVATRTKTVGKILSKLGAKRVQDLKPAQFKTALSMLE